MNPLKLILDPVRRAAHLFFKADLKLQRGRDGLHVVLSDDAGGGARRGQGGAGADTLAPSEFDAASARPAALARQVTQAARTASRSGRDADRKREKAEVQLALTQLAELLDKLPGTRRAMRQLDFVEQGLRKKGFRALDKLPLPVLRKALEQLDGLVTNWSPVGLANLRSKMAVAVLRREKEEPVHASQALAATAAEDDLDSSVLPETFETGPGELDGADEVDEAAALAAAYAALGSAPPAGPVEFQGELGSRSAKVLQAPLPRAGEPGEAIQIRTLA